MHFKYYVAIFFLYSFCYLQLANTKNQPTKTHSAERVDKVYKAVRREDRTYRKLHKAPINVFKYAILGRVNRETLRYYLYKYGDYKLSQQDVDKITQYLPVLAPITKEQLKGFIQKYHNNRWAIQ